MQHSNSLRRSPFLCRLDDASVLYYPLTDRLLLLNATAKIVWDLHSRGLDQRAIASTFAEHFGISDGQASRDVAQVLANLTDEHFGDEEKVNDVVAAGPSVTGSGVVDWENELVCCGVFRFGRSRVSVLSALPELDASFFLRFQHRSIDNVAADLLEISVRSPEAPYQLTFRGGVIAEAKTINQTNSQLMELLLSLEHPGQRFLAYCHAAAVSYRGRSLLMPGNSGVGKSTLTGYLVAHGFAYLGDDVIAIGEDDISLSLLPLPTCLSIKAGSWAILEPLFPALAKLVTLNRYERSFRYVAPQGNYESLQAAAAPSAIVFPSYSAGEATRLKPLRPLDTMIHLLEANVRLSGWGPATEEQLARFVRFVEQTPAYELSYSELPEAMKAIEELLGSQP